MITTESLRPSIAAETECEHGIMVSSLPLHSPVIGGVSYERAGYQMSDYRRVLERLAQGRVRERMPSGSESEVQDWFDLALRHAEDQVRIYADDLNWHVFMSPQVLEGFKAFLSKPWVQLQILLRKTPRAAGFQPLLECAKAGAGVTEVRVATGNYATQETPLFTVVDDVGYRFEGRVHFANFNEPSEAGKLLRTFDAAFAIGSQWIRIDPSRELGLNGAL
jgi:hypothetical protein